MIQNLTSSAFSEPVYPWAPQGTLILDIFVNKVLRGLGILVNLFFVILLSHWTLQHKVYDKPDCLLANSNLQSTLPLTLTLNGQHISLGSTRLPLGYSIWWHRYFFEYHSYCRACSIKALELLYFSKSAALLSSAQLMTIIKLI